MNFMTLLLLLKFAALLHFITEKINIEWTSQLRALYGNDLRGMTCMNLIIWFAIVSILQSFTLPLPRFYT